MPKTLPKLLNTSNVYCLWDKWISLPLIAAIPNNISLVGYGEEWYGVKVSVVGGESLLIFSPARYSANTAALEKTCREYEEFKAAWYNYHTNN